MSVIMEGTGRAPCRYVGRGTVTPEQKRRALALSQELQKTLGKPLNHV